MFLIKVLSIILVTVALVKCQIQTSNQIEEEQQQNEDEEDENSNLSTTLLTSVLNSSFIQEKLQKFYNIIDLKFRFIRFIYSLFTRDNLILLRRFTDLITTICNSIKRFLPEPTPEESFLATWFPEVNLNPVSDDNSAFAAAATSENISNVGRIERSSEKIGDFRTNVGNIEDVGQRNFKRNVGRIDAIGDFNNVVVQNEVKSGEFTSNVGKTDVKPLKLSKEDEDQLKKYRDDVMNIAKLIYKTK